MWERKKETLLLIKRFIFVWAASISISTTTRTRTGNKVDWCWTTVVHQQHQQQLQQFEQAIMLWNNSIKFISNNLVPSVLSRITVQAQSKQESLLYEGKLIDYYVTNLIGLLGRTAYCTSRSNIGGTYNNR